MTDRVDRETRSRVMGTVRSKGTRLEVRFAEALAIAGISDLERHPPGIPGRPDWGSREARLAIFIDSCFWHGCPQHLRMPASRLEYWNHKIARNRRRDREINQGLRQDGWMVIRIWEHQAKDRAALKRALRRIRRRLSAAEQFAC